MPLLHDTPIQLRWPYCDTQRKRTARTGQPWVKPGHDGKRGEVAPRYPANTASDPPQPLAHFFHTVLPHVR